jgi:hypothetical protein
MHTDHLGASETSVTSREARRSPWKSFEHSRETVFKSDNKAALLCESKFDEVTRFVICVDQKQRLK